MKNKNLILFLFGGFVFRYGLDLADMVITWLTNKQTLSATKAQIEINNLVGSQEQIDTHAIGFIQPEDYLEEDEYYE